MGTCIRQDRLEESVMHSPKVLECGDGSNGGTVYDVATVVQHMTVYADLPHLRGTSDLRCQTVAETGHPNVNELLQRNCYDIQLQLAH